MNRNTAWCVPFALLALSPAAQSAEPGFYFAATASRVEHEIDGLPGVLVFIANPGPIPVLPPDVGFNPRPTPIIPINPNPILNPVAAVPDSVTIDDVDAGYSATVGYRINRYLAAELSYTDFGEYERSERFVGISPDLRYQISIRGPSISVLGSLPLGEQWELFLRGGVLFADQEVTTSLISTFKRDYSDEVVTGGAGVQWSFAPRWAARLEYQRTADLKYDTTSESTIEQASLSVLFKL